MRVGWYEVVLYVSAWSIWILFFLNPVFIYFWALNDSYVKKVFELVHCNASGSDCNVIPQANCAMQSMSTKSSFFLSLLRLIFWVSHIIMERFSTDVFRKLLWKNALLLNQKQQIQHSVQSHQSRRTWELLVYYCLCWLVWVIVWLLF